jgi:hypothetical protein
VAEAPVRWPVKAMRTAVVFMVVVEGVMVVGRLGRVDRMVVV